ncbi:MAG: PAS domain S-box protein [Rhodospirillales bacterium]|nr:PAS domain S-box protein [Rhodospirillales bacterium]
MIRSDVTERVMAQLALAERESELRTLTDLSPVGIYRIGPDGLIIYVNDRWREIMGLEGDAALGDGWIKALHPEDRDSVIESWQEFVNREDEKYSREDEKYSVDCRIIRPDGSTAWLISQATRDYGENGELLGYVGSITDITEQKSTEQALAESEERFSLATRGSNDGLWDWDLETGDTYYSPRWSEMLGYESGELPDTREAWTALLHPDDRSRIDEFLTNCLEGEAKGYDVEIRLCHKDGHYVDILARAFAVRGDEGAPVRVVGTNSDISARKQAEATLLENEEKFRAITENTTDIIVVLNQDGIHKYVSPSAARAAGMKAEEFIDKPVGDILHPEDADVFMRTLRRAWKHPGETIFAPEFRVTYPDGKTLLFEALITALPNVPGVDGIVLNARDITTRKRTESDLLIAKEQAEAANKAKSAFLSSMSHELRTPMNAILGFSQLLEQNATGPLNQNQKEFIGEILRSGRHMLELIGDVLDLAKIESGGVDLDLESQVPRPLIDACLQMVGASANQDGITVRSQFPAVELPMIKVDGLRFKQALLNLLSNAVKYNRPGGEVILECNSGANGILHITVSDTGPGIPDTMRAKVFEPFDRLGAESSNIPGTGIGLTVTKELIESMGGTVGFESTVGEGTTFWINLPVAQVEAQPAI